MVKKFFSGDISKFFFKKFKFLHEFANLPLAKLKGDFSKTLSNLAKDAEYEIFQINKKEVRRKYGFSAKVINKFTDFHNISKKNIEIVIFQKNQNDRNEFYLVFGKKYWRELIKSDFTEDDGEVYELLKDLADKVSSKDFHFKENEIIENEIVEVEVEFDEKDKDKEIIELVKKELPAELQDLNPEHVLHSISFFNSLKDFKSNKRTLNNMPEFSEAFTKVKNFEFAQNLFSGVKINELDKGKTNLINFLEATANIAESPDLSQAEKAALSLKAEQLMQKIAHKQNLFAKYMRIIRKLAKKFTIKLKTTSPIQAFLYSKSQARNR